MLEKVLHCENVRGHVLRGNRHSILRSLSSSKLLRMKTHSFVKRVDIKADRYYLFLCDTRMSLTVCRPSA
jgi:hypothetical protein